MHRIFISALLISNCLLQSLVLSAQQNHLTLEYCQQKARANYPAIKQFDLIEKSKEYNVSNAGKAYLPQLSVTGIGAYVIQGLPVMPGSETTPEKFQIIGIGQLHQTIWDGGETHAQKEIILANAGVDSASIDVSLYSLNDRVNQLYFGILLIDEQLKQLHLLQENLQRNLDAANLSLQNGVAYQSDVDEVKVETIKSQQKETEFISTRKGYVDMLSQMIGEPIDENEKLEQPAELIALTATINRPELRLYENQRKLLDAQLKMVNVNYMPKIGLLGVGLLSTPGFAFGGATITSLALVGVNLSWNTAGLYTGSNTKQLSKINADKINNQQETFLYNTNLQLLQTKNDLVKDQTLLQQDDQIISLKESIRKSYETKFQNGMASMNDLLNAENEENDARSNRAVHEMQYLMSMYTQKTISGN